VIDSGFRQSEVGVWLGVIANLRSPPVIDNQNPVSELRAHWGTILASSVGVMASCVTLTNYSLGVFIVPLGEEFGWGRGQVLFATSIVSIGAVIMSFATGWLADKIDIARLIIASQIAFGLCFVAQSVFTNDLATFYVIYGVIAVVAAGTLPITFTKIVAARFEARRGLAIGLTLAGTGLSGFLVPPFAGYFVNTFGWRIGFLAVAALPGILAASLAFAFLRKATASNAVQPPPTATYGMELGEALRTWRYWVIAVAFFIASGAATGVSANIVPMMTDRGFDRQTAATLAGIFGLAVIAGRVILGLLVDKFWAPPIALAFLTPAAVATVFLATVPVDFAVATALLVVIGLATGAEGDLLSYLVARYFGVKAYGRIFSGIFAAFIAAIAVAAPFFGGLYDATKSYERAMEISAVGWVLCGIMLMTLGRYPMWPASKS